MGINEVDPGEKRWGVQPPKKKWKYWYMSFGDDERANGTPEQRGDEAPNALPHDTRPSFRATLSTPLKDSPTEGEPRPPVVAAFPRSAVGTTASVSPVVASPLRSSEGSLFSPGGEEAFVSSPSISPSNSSSGGGSISPLGLVSAFRTTPGGSSSDGSGGSLQRRDQCSPPGAVGTHYPLNGFLRLGLERSKGGVVPCGSEHEDENGLHENKEEGVKKRAGSTPSREVHNKLEKNRRAHLKECFEGLRRNLPSMEDKKISNQTILKAAHKYIQNMKRKEKEYEHEMERLAREKIAHQQKLASLKKELQTKWDHLDFSAILPDMNSLEQQKDKETKSTTTADEQPDIEEDSRDSLRMSTVPTQTSESSSSNSYVHLAPVDLTPTQIIPEKLTFHHHIEREVYPDPNQPLNLSTNTSVGERSPRRLFSPNPPIHHSRSNGEWPVRKTSPYSPNYTADKTPLPKASPSAGKTVQAAVPMLTAVGKMTNISPQGMNPARSSPFSTNASHISSLPTASVATAINTNVTNLSHIVKPGTTLAHIPSITKVVTTLPHVSALTPVGTTISAIPSTLSSNIGQIHISNSDHGNHQQTATAVPVRASVAHISNITNGGTAMARVSSSAALSNVNSTVTVASTEHPIPIVGGGGIQLPAHLVTNSVHLTGATGSIIGQPAIQVFTPEGYKLIPAEHAHNGVKPVAFALAQPGGLEHLPNVEEGKHTPVMVAVNKNGLSALHLTMPATARAITSNTAGNSMPVTSVPLNLTVPGATQTVKVTQAGSTPLISSYIPLNHANGLTRLVQGMSVVGPLVVSQSQRGGMVVPANITTPNNKGIKGHSATGVVSTAGGGVPLAQYATTLTGGLVNSVVVVSASAPAPAVTSSLAISTAKN